jgi:hypothetical protein
MLTNYSTHAISSLKVRRKQKDIQYSIYLTQTILQATLQIKVNLISINNNSSIDTVQYTEWITYRSDTI